MTLQHPLHEHALTRKQLSESWRFECYVCKQDGRGTAYCCEETSCYLFLHESCALTEIPLQIVNHPIHPDHPLVLEKGGYSCHVCELELKAREVIATLSPLQEEDTIQHFSHDHTLTAFHVKVPNWMCCVGCGGWIPGPAYGCHSCRFFLHESCARLPQEMPQHPFHPQHPLTLVYEPRTSTCKACTHFTGRLAYCCEDCDFKLDIACAALPLPLQDQEKEDRDAIDHISHQHQLLSGRVEENEHLQLCCPVCELKISGEVYYCFGCIFFVHKLCAAELLPDMVHYLHPEHCLILIPKPLSSDGSFVCGCCRGRYYGMSFHCASCDFDLDPNCALLTVSACQDGIAAEIQHFGHEHPLLLSFYKAPLLYVDCKACSNTIMGPTYTCYRCSCFLHPSCVELPLQIEHHPLHPLHPLTLLPNTPEIPFVCDNCSSQSGGFTFGCTGCAVYLCTPCATERPTLKHQLHEHALSYFERGPAKDSGRCNYCGKGCSIDLYCCTPCNFNLHRECLPLPPTIQHECHPYHPLVLIDRYVDFRPDDLWCDYCEERRNPDRGVYRCEECWYTVHIGCVLPQVRQHENPYVDKLRKDIASLKETIEEREKDLEALKEKLSRLETEERSELANT